MDELRRLILRTTIMHDDIPPLVRESECNMPAQALGCACHKCDRCGVFHERDINLPRSVRQNSPYG